MKKLAIFLAVGLSSVTAHADYWAKLAVQANTHCEGLQPQPTESPTLTVVPGDPNQQSIEITPFGANQDMIDQLVKQCAAAIAQVRSSGKAFIYIDIATGDVVPEDGFLPNPPTDQR